MSLSDADPRAVSAGRGLAYITLAKLWFMVGGSAIGFVLPWLLHSKERYGEWGFIVSIISPINNVMVTATIQTVAKFASRGRDYVEGVKRAALRLQLVLGVGVAASYFFATPWIAQFERDADQLPTLRLATGVVLAYSFYAVFVGAANGAREFQKQAGLDIAFTTLRAVLVCGAAWLFLSVHAAVGGFVLAAVSVLVLSVGIVGLRPTIERTSTRELVRFFVPVAAYLLILNLLMFVDGLLLKRLVTAAAERGGVLHPEESAKAAVGLYTAAQNIARLPYQMILSVTFILFPLISQATLAADAERTRTYIRNSIRGSLLLVTMLATTVAAHPDAILSFFPRREYLPAGSALAVLSFGYVAFSLLSIAGTISNGTGRTRPTVVLGAVTLLFDVAGNYWAIGWALRMGQDPLLAAAAASTAAMGFGCAAALIDLRLHFGASLPVATALRSLIAAAIAISLGRLVPLQGKLALGGCIVGGVIFLAVLFALRELSLPELRRRNR